MAIAMRSFSASSTAAGSNGANSLVTAAPTGKSIGDLLVLSVTNRSNGGLGVPALGANSTGWSTVSPFSSASIIVSITSLATKWWWRVADGSANDTPTVTGSYTNGSDGNISYILMAITGANNAAPGDVGGSASATTATSTAIPAITTTAAGDMQVGVWSTYSSTAAAAPVFTTPTGFTAAGNTSIGTGNITGGQAAFYRIISSASALPAASATKTNPGTQQTMTTVALFAGATTTTNKIGWGVSIA